MTTLVRTTALAVTLSATACTFTPTDPRETTTVPPGDQTSPRHCSADEPGLVLCVDFEDAPLAPIAIDGSPFRHDVMVTAVTSGERISGELAAELGRSSVLHIPESPELDVQDFTIEMWVRPQNAPKDKLATLFENTGQYRMWFESDRRVRCGIPGPDDAIAEATIPLGAWSHVACRHRDGELRVYINGHVSGCRALEQPVSTASTTGSTIGVRLAAMGPGPQMYRDRLIGGVDNVRVYDVGLDDAALCSSAGQVAGTCRAACDD